MSAEIVESSNLPRDRLAMLSGVLSIGGVIVFGISMLVIQVAMNSSADSNPYAPKASIGALLLFSPFFLLGQLTLILGFILGLIAIFRLLRRRKRKGTVVWSLIGMFPVLAFIGLATVGRLWGDTSSDPGYQLFRSYLSMRSQMARARKENDSATIGRLKIPYGLVQFQHEFQFFDLAAGRYHYLNDTYPTGIIPQLSPPMLGGHTALDLPHDPFGEIEPTYYEFSGPQSGGPNLVPENPHGGWVVYNPVAREGERYRRLDGTIIEFSGRLDNDERFEPQERAFYRYRAVKDRYIALSRGPDEKWDFTDEEIDRLLKDPSDPIGLARQYDPTNGETSGGDLFRIQDYKY